MIIRKRAASGQSNRLQMTAMIDIVFLLLVFFVMTFQVTALEGDLVVGAEAPTRDGADALRHDLPLMIVVKADGEGEIASIAINGRAAASIRELNAQVRAFVERAPKPELLEAVLRCDEELKYQHTIAALSAVRGYRDEEGKIVPLIQNVRLAGEK